MKISKIISIVISIFAACLWQSCTSEDNTIATQQGYLSLSAKIDGSFAMSDGSTIHVPESQTPELPSFALTLSLGEEYSHTWSSFSEYTGDESYLVGQYDVKMESAALNDGPTFEGSKSVIISIGQRTRAEIECMPSDALLQFNVSQNSAQYQLNGITVHSDGGRYGEYSNGENLYILPGNMQMYAQLSDEQNRSIRVAIPYQTSLSAAHGEAVDVNLSSDELTLKSAKQTSTYTIDSSIFELSAPTITAEGFTVGEQIDATEGLTLTKSIKMHGTSSRPITSARLSVESPILNIVGAPAEIDLVKLSSEDLQYLEQVGLKFKLSTDSMNLDVDYTGLLENMSSYTSALSHFSLMIEDEAGVCSEPLTLDVNTRVMTFTLESVSTAMIGVNTATMVLNAGGYKIEQSDFNLYATDSDGKQTACAITSWQQVDSQRVEIGFSVPEGSSDINVDVYYLDLKRLSTAVSRVAPDYTFEVDAFATNAIVRFTADNEDIANAMAKYATPVIDGITALSFDRYDEQQLILIRNLQPEKHYSISLSVANTGKQTQRFTTETAEQVPEGDFEDWEQLIDYKQLPQGGKYSSTELSIVNRQNFTDVDVKWPKKYWASVNAKTFNKQSSNHNTWYMQPSSVIIYEPQSGYKAIRMTSVGWDHSGEKIADYVQQHGESRPYSNVVPKVSHRSAGRLFLGTYSYDFATQKEVFNEGYAFKSRPSSLNGFYMYTPDITHQTDRGYVEIELLNVTDGKETVIASGRAEFQTATDYMAFNVPLTYSYYNLKATKLKIMFASTTATGTQSYEDENVPLTAHPETGELTGSKLWIDNLSFTY